VRFRQFDRKVVQQLLACGTGARCASLNRAAEDLAAAIAAHQPALSTEKRLLLATLDGSKNALPVGMPDPAADAGAPLDWRYPAVYISRRTVGRTKTFIMHCQCFPIFPTMLV
jgi:hypothetical protein